MKALAIFRELQLNSTALPFKSVSSTFFVFGLEVSLILQHGKSQKQALIIQACMRPLLATGGSGAIDKFFFLESLDRWADSFLRTFRIEHWWPIINSMALPHTVLLSFPVSLSLPCTPAS